MTANSGFFSHDIGIKGRDYLWQEQSKCNEQTHDWFFSKSPSDIKKAKGLCASCPVREDCLKDALSQDIIYGIWGGYHHSELRKMKKGLLWK